MNVGDDYSSEVEAQLIEALKQGRPEAHKSLEKRYAPRLLSYIKRWVGNLQDAEEILNDVLCAVITKIDSFDPSKSGSPEPFRTWVYTISKNKIRDHLRERKRKKEQLAEAGIEAVLSLTDRDVVEEVSSMQALPSTPKTRALSQALHNLSERDRFLLGCISNKVKPAEIAVYLGLKSETVRSHVYRAKHRLLKELQKYPEFDDFFHPEQ